MEPVSHYYYSHRLKLQFWDWGQDGKPTLLLVHGGLDHARNWDWVARSLREHFHVYAMDQRGHGESDPADIYHPIAAYDDLSGVVEELGLSSFVMIGLSMGGRNAMYFTSKRPDVVQKLVIVDIVP